jgi:hypothetical protein
MHVPLLEIVRTDVIAEYCLLGWGFELTVKCNGGANSGSSMKLSNEKKR